MRTTTVLVSSLVAFTFLAQNAVSYELPQSISEAKVAASLIDVYRGIICDTYANKCSFSKLLGIHHEEGTRKANVHFVVKGDKGEDTQWVEASCEELHNGQWICSGLGRSFIVSTE